MNLKAIIKNYRNYIISFWIALSLILISNQWIGAATPIRIPIFSIHEIVDLNNLPVTSLQSLSLYTNTKQDLENFLDYLVRNKYWFLSSQELYDYFLTKSKPVPSEHLYQKKI